MKESEEAGHANQIQISDFKFQISACTAPTFFNLPAAICNLQFEI